MDEVQKLAAAAQESGGKPRILRKIVDEFVLRPVLLPIALIVKKGIYRDISAEGLKKVEKSIRTLSPSVSSFKIHFLAILIPFHFLIFFFTDIPYRVS